MTNTSDRHFRYILITVSSVVLSKSSAGWKSALMTFKNWNWKWSFDTISKKVWGEELDLKIGPGEVVAHAVNPPLNENDH